MPLSKLSAPRRLSGAALRVKRRQQFIPSCAVNTQTGQICGGSRHPVHRTTVINGRMPVTCLLYTSDGELNVKYPEAIELQKRLLEEEGHTIITKGTKNIKYYVKDFEKSLIKL